MHTVCVDIEMVKYDLNSGCVFSILKELISAISCCSVHIDGRSYIVK